ncbi:hypothetical protein TNCV_2183171 [Trichonephila clavipes]|nr:hypothetical protein TNCV_2183171 [Trichonephila clavipes]
MVVFHIQSFFECITVLNYLFVRLYDVDTIYHQPLNLCDYPTTSLLKLGNRRICIDVQFTVLLQYAYSPTCCSSKLGVRNASLFVRYCCPVTLRVSSNGNGPVTLTNNSRK